MSKIILVGFLLLLAVVSLVYLLPQKPSPASVPPVSGPSPVISPAVSSLILEFPKPNETITGPLVIKGLVPASWTFEGQFVMELLDEKRDQIVKSRVPVEWDSDHRKDSLYFTESFNYSYTGRTGFLVLSNDNPSGLPQNRKSYEIPLKFAPSPPGTVYLFDQGSGSPEIDNQCQIVLPRAVSLGSSKTPIKDTLDLLARKMHPDFYVKSLNLNNSLLTIEFPDIYGFTTGGSCAQNINRLRVEKTALQFHQVREVRIIPDSVFQP